MTAHPPAAPRSRFRVFAGRLVGTTALLLVVVGGPVLVKCVPDWKDAVYTFPFEGGDYRVRLTGAAGTECAKLEHEDRNSRSGPWIQAGIDCAWPRVAGGGGWLAGGRAEQIYDRRAGSFTPDWLFFGIVPAAATEVVLTLADGMPHRIATRPAGEGKNRIYAHHQRGIDGPAEIVAVELRDAVGGELRVY